MRKLFLRTLFISAAVSSLFVVRAFADDATVTGNEVNVRSGPGTNYSVIDCLDVGTKVTVNDMSDPSWYNISFNGNTGFMYSSYLKLAEVEIEETVDPVQETQTGESTGFINAMYVRFRSGPSTGYSVLGEYNSGTALTILGTSGDWTKVLIKGQEGFVFSSYVTANEQAAYVQEPEVETEPEPEIEPEPEVIIEPEVEYSSPNGYINAYCVNFRTGPGTGYSIIASYSHGTQLTVKGAENGWTKAVINGREGYVYSQYVTENDEPEVEEEEEESEAAVTPAQTGTSGYIKGTTVRFRYGASTSTGIIGEYNTGKELTVIGYSGDWTQCIIDGQTGYVYSTYVTESKPSVSTTGSQKGQQIASFALQYLGYDYNWGGSSPETGFDCSGFVYYVYGNFGYTIERVACNQATCGVHVDHDDLQPGDILCFYSGDDGYIGHSGLYIGNGQFIHASTYTTGVIISDLETDSYEARRIVS